MCYRETTIRVGVKDLFTATRFGSGTSAAAAGVMYFGMM